MEMNATVRYVGNAMNSTMGSSVNSTVRYVGNAMGSTVNSTISQNADAMNSTANSTAIRHDGDAIRTVWNRDEILLLIQSVREKPALYNSTHKQFRNFRHTEEIWANIDIKLGKAPGSAKEKWANLRALFRHEHLTNRKSGWLFYNDIAAFLTPYLRRRGPNLNTLIKEVRQEVRKRSETGQENSPPCPDIDILTRSISPISRPSGVKPKLDRVYINKRRPKVPVLEMKVLSPSQEMPPPPRADESPNVSIVQAPRQREEPSPEILIEIEEVPAARTKARTIYRPLARSTPAPEAPHITIHASPEEPKGSIEETPRQFGGAKNTMNILNISQQIMTPAKRKESEQLHHPCNCRADNDVMFMQSLMPDVKKMRPDVKLFFKIQVQQLIQNLLYKSE